MLTKPLNPPLTEKELDLLDRTNTSEREKLLIGEIRRLRELNKAMVDDIQAIEGSISILLTSRTG
jgi:hypothetical protein